MYTPAPALLTRELCLDAFYRINPVIVQAMRSGLFNKEAGLLTVLNPAIPPEPKYSGGPSNKKFLEDLPFFLAPFGNYRKWDSPYALVSLSKGYGAWEVGCDSRLIPPARFKPGMSTFPGAIVGKSGAIISFSGVEAYFDETIAMLFDSMLYGLVMQRLAKLEEMGDPDRRSLRVSADLTVHGVAMDIGYDIKELLQPVYDLLEDDSLESADIPTSAVLG